MLVPWLEASRLWLVLDRQAAAPRSLAEVAELAIQGGVDVVLCRIKDAPLRTMAKLSEQVREKCRQHNCPFVMSHNYELAHDLEADGLQLGISDPPLIRIRGVIGEGMPVGFSTHSVQEARQRFEQGASYVFLGPIYATPAKLKYGLPLGLATARQARALKGEVILIGGINGSNIQELSATWYSVDPGKREPPLRVAAIGALQRVLDPLRASQELKSHLLNSC